MTRPVPETTHEPEQNSAAEIDEGWDIDLATVAAGTQSKIVSLGTAEEIDVPAADALHRPSEPLVSDGEPDVLGSMRGFGMESGHVHRVDKILTESVACAIARSTVSGSSDVVKRAREGEGPVSDRTGRDSNRSTVLRLVFAAVALCLLGAVATLIWVAVSPASPPVGANVSPAAAEEGAAERSQR